MTKYVDYSGYDDEMIAGEIERLAENVEALKKWKQQEAKKAADQQRLYQQRIDEEYENLTIMKMEQKSRERKLSIKK